MHVEISKATPLLLQDEKNEMLHTNTWLNYVSSLRREKQPFDYLL